jgi:site-specific DNA recombinase
MTPTKQPRAAIYARYSTDKQREASIEDQYTVCERIAAREGAKIVKRFHDKGISGGTGQRPGYKAMLTAARAGEFDLIIAEDTDRIWRNRADYGNASVEWEDLRVHLVTAVGDDTRRDGWGLLIQIKIAMGEHERKKASYRTRRGQEGKAREGKSVGGRAYWYTPASKSSTGMLEINPYEAKIVLKIFKWRANGWTARQIAHQLNVDKVPPPGNKWSRDPEAGKNRLKEWKPSAIAGDPRKGVGILNNALYKGEVVWGRRKWVRSATDSAIRRPTTEHSEAVVTFSDPKRLRIVPDALWEKVRKLQIEGAPHLKGKTGRKAGRESAHWLGGLLVCECGSNMMAYGARSYICSAQLNGTAKCKNNLYVRREEVDDAVFSMVRESLLSEEAIAGAQEEFRELVRDLKRDRAAKSPAAASAEVKAIESRIEELQRAAKKGPLTLEDLQPSLEKLQRERTEAEARATGKADKALNAALETADLLPRLMEQYEAQVERAIRGLGAPGLIAEARSETRDMLEGGRIVLAPTRDRSALEGVVRFTGIGERLLKLTGLARAVSKAGSGGRI